MIRPLFLSRRRRTQKAASGLRFGVAAFGVVSLGILSLGLGLGGSGCSGAVAQAPFRLRPDTTNWGSLFGPFDGQVLDQATGNPISGALVVGSWAFEAERGPAVPLSAYSITAITNNDGGYNLPALPTTQRSLSLLRRFTLVVYKAGYIGYRSDTRWEDRSPRTDFSQLANKARLERIPAGESRAHILAFLGGGQALMRAAQAEVIQAALDLAERSPALPTLKSDTEGSAERRAKPDRPLTLAEQLLPIADVEASVRGARRVYSGEPLPTSLVPATAGDQKAAATPVPAEDVLDRVEYSGVHYGAKDAPESHDAALRIWRAASGTDAEAVWKRLQGQLQAPPLRDASGTVVPTLQAPAQRGAQPLLPEVPLNFPPLRDANGVGRTLLPHVPAAAPTQPLKPISIDASVSAYDNKRRTYGIAVLVRKLGLVVELLCGADLCPGEEAVHGLLNRALERL